MLIEELVFFSVVSHGRLWILQWCPHTHALADSSNWTQCLFVFNTGSYYVASALTWNLKLTIDQVGIELTACSAF